MAAKMDNHRALVRGFIDGTLAGDEHASLEVQLRDPDIARHFLRELHFDQAIRVAARSQDRRAEIEATPNAPVTARLRVRRTARWRPTLTRWTWARTAAALLILALPASLALSLSITKQPFAQLMVHLGTVQVGDQARDGASDLHSGQELTVSPRGWASVRLADGTLIELESGTHLTLSRSDDGLRLALTTGALKADVRHQPPGRPLIIETPRSRATVLGTRLGFVTSTTDDRLAVTEGLVNCARRSDGSSIDVPAGQAVSINASGALALRPIGPPIDAIPEPPTLGLTLWFDPTQGVTRDATGRVERWSDRSGHTLMVTNTNPRQRPSVDLSGHPSIRFAPRGEMLSGRAPWPTTGAFTIAIALRPTQFARWSQNFGWGWGCFAFHAQEGGGIFAGVGAPGGGIRFQPGTGVEDIPPGTAVIGRWQRFIITYGNGVGAFYADGNLLARKAMPPPEPRQDLYFGRANAPDDEPSSFAGDLGEVLLYDRLLEAHEIILLDRRLRGTVTP